MCHRTLVPESAGSGREDSSQREGLREREGSAGCGSCGRGGHMAPLTAISELEPEMTKGVWRGGMRPRRASPSLLWQGLP